MVRWFGVISKILSHLLRRNKVDWGLTPKSGIMKYTTRKYRIKILISVLIIIAAGLVLLFVLNNETDRNEKKFVYGIEIPEYSGKPCVAINDNKPFFTEDDMRTESFETYSNLDSLGRCGVAFANVGRDLMPIDKRGEIGEIKPSGWVQAKYEGIVDSTPPYLYNRCHLIAYCLTAENDNEKNLITGTRYMNVEGMMPFEEQVADYLDKNDNHVLYRVTPVFVGRNLLADGVLIEAYSVEDHGKGICFCEYVYNVQPGITIDYRTGESSIGVRPH